MDPEIELDEHPDWPDAGEFRGRAAVSDRMQDWFSALGPRRRRRSPLSVVAALRLRYCCRRYARGGWISMP